MHRSTSANTDLLERWKRKPMEQGRQGTSLAGSWKPSREGDGMGWRKTIGGGVS